MSAVDMSEVEAKRDKLRALLAQRAAAPRRYPVSFAQERLWFLDRLVPGNPFYNVEAAIPIDAAVDPDLLERCVNEIVRRHAALRTTFRDGDDHPQQVVAPELHVPLQRVDLRALSSTERDAAALDIRRERAQTAFNLETGPLIITDLLRLGEQQWLFLLHMHHIVSDGWSMGVFSRELTALYEAFAAGRPSPLAPLALQYGDFALWQRQAFAGDALQREFAYWGTQLDGLAPLDLATDRPRPAEQSHRGAFHTVHFERALGEAVQQGCRALGVTPFMILLAAFKALLARYTHSDDIAVGTYIANRDREELEPLIGFFLNTLALRTRVDVDSGFAALAGRVKQTALGAYAHQALPFATLVQALAPERDLSRNPLVQVVFQLQNAASADGAGALVDYQRGAAIFDIAVTCYEANGQFHATWEYASDLFDPATIEAMARHYARLLGEALADPAKPLRQLALLDAAERAALLAHGSGPSLPISDQSLAAMLDGRAAATPDAPAFIDGAVVLTFADLASRSTQLARRLVALGVQPGDACGVCLARGLDLPVALFAVWRAGAAYLPLDPEYPRERLAYMLQDSGARALIGLAGEPTAAALAGGAGIALIDPACLEAVTAPLPPPAGPDALSHILYTSGSTGRPKAAPSPHRQILNRLHWMWRHVPFADGTHGEVGCEVGCVKTATSFIDSLWELTGPLLQGLPSVIVPQAMLLQPEHLIALLAEHRVSRLWLVPSYLRVLLDCAPDLGARLPALHTWVASGEVLPVELQRRFEAAHPAATLFNLYGTSEVWDATWFDPRTTSTTGAARIPIGRPIDNVCCVVLDRWGEPVPLGVVGELHVGGAALGSTVESPRRLMLAGSPAREVWACGDLVRWRGDGNLEFVGRSDAELKIRGMRVEPAEVEAVLAEHPAVRTAALLAWPAPGGDLRLAAYVVALDPAATPDQLRAHMAQRLPAYMLPQQFVFIDTMPYTGSGKIDRAALRARGDPGAVAALPFTQPQPQPQPQPQGATEQAVAAIWEELLGHRVDVHENFFAAGGHSLLAVQVITRIQQTLGVRLELRTLFARPTVAALAEAVDAARGSNAAPEAAIPRAARRGVDRVGGK